MRNNQLGRSMVEMLGVLAIVGVLSAGALAGYNKAMMQHKLNKNAEEINYLLSIAIYNNDKLKDASKDMISELSALGAYTWPLTTITEGSFINVFDSLQNQIRFEHSSQTGSTAFCVKLPASEFAVKICQNYINIFKNFADIADMIYVTRWTDEAEEQNIYAGKNCTTGKCMLTITNTDILEMCKTWCSSANRCNLYMLWDYPQSKVQSLLNQ